MVGACDSLVKESQSVAVGLFHYGRAPTPEGEGPPEPTNQYGRAKVHLSRRIWQHLKFEIADLRSMAPPAAFHSISNFRLQIELNGHLKRISLDLKFEIKHLKFLPIHFQCVMSLPLQKTQMQCTKIATSGLSLHQSFHH